MIIPWWFQFNNWWWLLLNMACELWGEGVSFWWWMFGVQYDYVLVMIMIMIFVLMIYLWWWILTCKLVMILVVFAHMKGVGVYVGDLLYECMHNWVICSCIHKCPEAMIRGDVYDTISYQEAMFWGDDLDDDRYHMHIESYLGALHTFGEVVKCVIFDLCALVNLVNCVLGEIWWTGEDVYLMMFDIFCDTCTLDDFNWRCLFWWK